MARVKIEAGGKVLVTALIIGALLLLFIRVRASVNTGKVSVKPSQPAVEKQAERISDNKPAQKHTEEKSITPPESSPGAIKVFFDFNRAQINKNVYCIFDRIDEAVRHVGRQNLRIVVEGNADSIGSSWYNVSLSRMRAARVADSLSKRLGIPLNNIELVANGSTKPVASNETRDGRAENRRTEVYIYH